MSDADNLIYNRYDIIYPNNYEEYLYHYSNKEYKLCCHIENDTAVLNLWGKEIPEPVFLNCINDVFKNFSKVIFIKIDGSCNNYHGRLENVGNMYIDLPNSASEINERISSKTLHSLERKERRLSEKYGNITINIYWGNIPKKLVENYFKWKKTTHGTDYNLSCIEYLEKYHVTHALDLVVGEKSIAVVFYCICEKTAYLENLSFEFEAAKFSAGLIAYKKVLEWLSENGIKRFYLGKEGQEYKNHFGSIKQDTYWGYIISECTLMKVKIFLAEEGFRDIAIYGLGNIGKEFLRYSDYLGVKVVYAIDRKVKSYDSLSVYRIEEQLPACDGIVITLESDSDVIKQELEKRSIRFLNWRELLRR